MVCSILSIGVHPPAPTLLDILARGAKVNEDEHTKRDGGDGEERREDEMLVGKGFGLLYDGQRRTHPRAEKQDEDVSVSKQQRLGSLLLVGLRTSGEAGEAGAVALQQVMRG